MLPLLTGFGLVILVSGGWLAHAGDRYIDRLDVSERVAGYLIIAGLACFGVCLGMCFGAPWR